MTIIEALVGKTSPEQLLINVPKLLTANFDLLSDPKIGAPRVAFGTSGHHGNASEYSFNELHELYICQVICEYRKTLDINGPMYFGIDTHALPELAFEMVLEVVAVNGIETMIAMGDEYTSTPAVSHEILMRRTS